MSDFDSILEYTTQKMENSCSHHLLASPNATLTELIRVVVDETLSVYLNQQVKSTNIQLKLELSQKKNTLNQLEKLEQHLKEKLTQLNRSQLRVEGICQEWQMGILSSKDSYEQIKRLYLYAYVTS